jgi:FHA domain/Zinc-ribbon containing domain
VDTYLTGTLAGAGSFRCRDCGFAVALNALDEIPQCPHCGNGRFARASIFATGVNETVSLPDGEGEDTTWVEAAREEIDAPGDYLAYRHESQVCVLPLTQECTRIGRSLTADIRFDDPTVSRRHAIIVRQDGSVRVLDDRSLNGVFVNGERVEWSELSDGDELIVGRYHLHYLTHESAAEDARFRAATAA